jgi:glycosyltransferase involved in cell wall biosynthesis
VDAVSRALRVVHISKVKGIAGSERHLLWLLPALAARGADLRMIVLEDPRVPAIEFCEALESRGVRAETVRIGGHLDASLVGRLVDRLRSIGPDLVHTHLVHADWYGVTAARRAGIASVSSRHDNNPFRRRWIVRQVNRRVMRSAARIVAISAAVARFAVDVEGADPASVVTIHYGIEPGPRQVQPDAATRARWGIPSDTPVVGVVGRLIEQKGVDVLIEAFPAVLARHPSARLVIVGEGPARPSLERLVVSSRLEGRAMFAGWVRGGTSVMPACDVIVIPSRWEGFGIVALEAMACARPIVASSVDALPEIVVHERTGLLVPGGQPAPLAAAIRDLLDRPGWAAALGEAGRVRLTEDFTVDKMADAHLDLYAQVISGVGARMESSRS